MGDSDSQECILEQHGLHEGIGMAPNILRVEISPPGKDLAAPAEQWVDRVDQDKLPVWADAEEDERKAGIKFTNNPADTNLWQAMSIRQAGVLVTPAELMRQRGIGWTPAKKGPGSRVGGAQVVIALLRRNRFKVFNTCSHFLRTVPILMPDENNWEDVDTDMEDHCFSFDTKVWTKTRKQTI